MASLQQVQDQINRVAGEKGFQCVPVSWEDAERGTVGDELSCWGGNISDVRLWERTGQLLYTCRTENWNERLGYVAAKDVAVVVGNQVSGGGQPVEAVTLSQYLRGVGDYARYAGLETAAEGGLYAEPLDELCTIRFQTVFLPVSKRAGEEYAKTEFCTEVYNYNTRSDDDPRNLTILSTPQGTSLQQDGSGAQRVYHHEVDAEGYVHRYWLEAEKSEHKVGGAQKESAEEAAAAVKRGKSAAIHIGTRAMGTRFNVQLLIQVPLKQEKKQSLAFCFNQSCCSSSGDEITEECYISEVADTQYYVPQSDAEKLAADEQALLALQEEEYARLDEEAAFMRCERKSERKIGTSNAARVSRGSEEDVWPGVAQRNPSRDVSQHPTITVTMYYTVEGGVPSEADVRAAVADLDELYSKCASDKRLVDCSEVTKPLTSGVMAEIAEKVTTQAYTPPVQAQAPNNAGGFPSE